MTTGMLAKAGIQGCGGAVLYRNQFRAWLTRQSVQSEWTENPQGCRRADIQQVRAEMQQLRGKMKYDMRAMETRLVKWVAGIMIGTMLGSLTATAALLRLFL